MRILDVLAESQKEAIKLVKKILLVESDLFEITLVEKSNKGMFNFLSKKLPSHYYIHAIKDKTPFDVCIRGILHSVIEKMGYVVEIKSIEKNEQNKFLVILESPDARYIIGKKGKTLEALQLLVNILLAQFQDNAPKVLLNISSYREKREEYLISLSERIAEKVLEQQRDYVLMPLNPYERRIIHRELEKIENLETISVGKTPMKRVRIRYTGVIDHNDLDEESTFIEDDGCDDTHISNEMDDVRNEQSKFSETIEKEE